MQVEQTLKSCENSARVANEFFNLTEKFNNNTPVYLGMLAVMLAIVAPTVLLFLMKWFGYRV